MPEDKSFQGFVEDEVIRQLPVVFRAIRDLHSLHQSQLAKQLQMSPGYYSRLESGEYPIRLKILVRFGLRFGLRPSSLLLLAESLRQLVGLPEASDQQKQIATIWKFLKKQEQLEILKHEKDTHALGNLERV